MKQYIPTILFLITEFTLSAQEASREETLKQLAKYNEHLEHRLERT